MMVGERSNGSNKQIALHTRAYTYSHQNKRAILWLSPTTRYLHFYPCSCTNAQASLNRDIMFGCLLQPFGLLYLSRIFNKTFYVEIYLNFAPSNKFRYPCECVRAHVHACVWVRFFFENLQNTFSHLSRWCFRKEASFRTYLLTAAKKDQIKKKTK